MNTLQFDPGATGMTFTNHTGATIPPFGVFAVEEAEWDANGFYTCHAVLIDDVTVAGTNLFALNGGAPVGDGKTGRCFLAMHQPAWALVSPSMVKADIAQADGNYIEIGPEDGRDYLTLSGAGFLVVGGKFTGSSINNSRLLVIKKAGGGGGAEIIHFEIFQECVDIFLKTGCACAFATVTRLGCNVTSVAVDDEILVWDPDRCWLNLPIELLYGLRGWATKMKNDDVYGETSCPESQTDLGSCRWFVQGLCCSEEVYG